MELPETTQSVVPTRGAIVRAIMRQYRPAGICPSENRQRPGRTLWRNGPARRSSKSQPGIVSDAGMVYMSGLQQTGILNVQWGKSAAQQCNASFTLPAREGKAAGISQIETICR
jgi:outer membrane usher protein